MAKVISESPYSSFVAVAGGALTLVFALIAASLVGKELGQIYSPPDRLCNIIRILPACYYELTFPRKIISGITSETFNVPLFRIPRLMFLCYSQKHIV